MLKMLISDSQQLALNFYLLAKFLLCLLDFRISKSLTNLEQEKQTNNQNFKKGHNEILY